MMKTVVVLLIWCVLFALAWPLAVGLLFLLPLLWLTSIPIRLLIWVVEAALALAKTILFLPARLAGWRGTD